VANSPSNPVLRHIHRWLVSASAEECGDGQLLHRFVLHHDEAAFEALLRRYGPMVFGLCRRVLGDEHEAEDAFQAAFLVLAQKAGAVQNQTSVAGWLHRVALRIALKAREAAARRRMHEQQRRPTLEMGPEAEASQRELGGLLDEELLALPERYRLPIVLCCLQDHTRSEAARLLGWKEGTVASRLGRGRELLRGRLLRRGFAVSSVLFAPGVTRAGMASVPSSLAQGTARLATLLAVGEGELSPSVAGMVKAAMHTMLMSKVRSTAVLLIAVGVLALGAGLAAHQTKPPREEKQDVLAPPLTPSTERTPRSDFHGDPLPPGALRRLGTVRFRHGGGVYSIAFSPDGRTLVSTGGDGRARLWDAATGMQIRELLHRPQRELTFAVFSPDGKTIAAGGPQEYAPQAPPKQMAVYLIEVATGKLLRELRDHEPSLSGAAFSPNSKVLATTTGVVRLWDVATGELRGQFNGAGKVLAFSADGKRLITAGGQSQPDPKKPGKTLPGGGDIRIHEAGSGKVLDSLVGEQGPISKVVLSQDGNTLVAGSEDTTICLWDLKTRKQIRKLIHDRAAGYSYGGVESLALSPDRRVLASGGSDHVIRLWDLDSGKLLRKIAGHKWWVVALAFSPDGKTLASGSWDGTIRLWDVATGTEKQPWRGHERSLKAVYSPDGATIATVSFDETIRLWDTATGRTIRHWRAHENGASCLAFSPDSTLLASGGRDMKVRLWNARTGAEVRVLDGHQPTNIQDHIDTVAFSADGKWLFSGGISQTKVILWEVATGKQWRDLPLPRVQEAAFAPNGKVLAAGGWDEKIHLWNVAANREMRVLSPQRQPNPTPYQAAYITSLAFSPDGQTLACAVYDHTVRLYDVATGEELRRLKGHQGIVWAVRFSPDGKWLASGSLDETVRLWEVATGQEAHQLRGHSGWVISVDYSPDGKCLLTGGLDTTALVWTLSPLPDGSAAKSLPPREMEQRWNDLAAGDASVAYRARWQLVAAEDQSVAFLREHMPPVVVKDAERVKRLIADLDRDSFDIREAAEKELARRGSAVEPALREALAGNPSLELRRRIQSLLAALRSKDSPEALRIGRALQALEQIGTPKARQLLEALAGGASAARLTREAKASLIRLSRRPVVKP
jgi:RNA polymerase sigma factor (sigma-70 family)